MNFSCDFWGHLENLWVWKLRFCKWASIFRMGSRHSPKPLQTPPPLKNFSSDLHWSHEWSLELEKSLKSVFKTEDFDPWSYAADFHEPADVHEFATLHGNQPKGIDSYYGRGMGGGGEVKSGRGSLWIFSGVRGGAGSTTKKKMTLIGSTKTKLMKV